MATKNNKRQLSATETLTLLATLDSRFGKNMKRHEDIVWTAVEERLLQNPDKLWALNEMEASGGEPDVVALNKKTGEYTFYDCAPESPKGRRSLCFDEVALASRKENKPADSAMHMAAHMGVEMLTEQQYRMLQELGEFDTKTSSWVQTPDEIRKLGGALFCDRRYNTVFLYHNGAESYYAARGFRGCLTV